MIEHNDAYSRAVFLRFKEALAPLMVDIAPDWLLHHIEMERDMDCRDMSERVQIRLVIKPIEVARAMGIPVARVHQIKYRDKVKALNNQSVEVKITLLDRIKWWIKK